MYVYMFADKDECLNCLLIGWKEWQSFGGHALHCGNVLQRRYSTNVRSSDSHIPYTSDDLLLSSTEVSGSLVSLHFFSEYITTAYTPTLEE